MTVKELINELQTLPEELQVFISRDQEGNGFSTAVEVEYAYMVEDKSIHPSDVGTEYNVEDIYRAVVIWP